MVLLSLVPLSDLWVDVNFKEDQLRHLRIGQPVELTTDVYGDDIVFTGKIVGLGAGTGSVFSLLPPQNATGNWIKIVQRLAVRVSLDEEILTDYPLRLGLSMDATVDTHERDGATLAPVESSSPRYVTDVFDQLRHNALRKVTAMLDRHLGAPNP